MRFVFLFYLQETTISASEKTNHIIKDQEKSSEREEFVIKHIAEENWTQEIFQQTLSYLAEYNIDQQLFGEGHIHYLELYEDIQ